MRATSPLLRRVRYYKLTTKQASTGYYKGTRTGAMGQHTKHGGYIINYDKVRSYVCPKLDGFELTPFVAMRIKPPSSSDTGYKPPMNGERYLDLWKKENGED